MSNLAKSLDKRSNLVYCKGMEKTKNLVTGLTRMFTLMLLVTPLLWVACSAVLSDGMTLNYRPAPVEASVPSDCWKSGETPKAELPGSVLLSNGNRVSAQPKVHKAFTEALGGPEAPFNFVALCS